MLNPVLSQKKSKSSAEVSANPPQVSHARDSSSPGLSEVSYSPMTNSAKNDIYYSSLLHHIYCNCGHAFDSETSTGPMISKRVVTYSPHLQMSAVDWEHRTVLVGSFIIGLSRSMLM